MLSIIHLLENHIIHKYSGMKQCYSLVDMQVKTSYAYFMMVSFR